MSDPDSARRARRRMAARVAGSGLILAALLTFLPFDQLLAALARIPVPVWALSVLAYLTLHLLGVTKWRLMVNAAGGGLSMGATVRCYYYGLFGNTFLPSLVGGDLVRVGLALRLARSRSGVLVGSLADRTLDVLSLASVAGIGVLLLPRALDEQGTRVFWLLGVALLVAVVAALLVGATLPVGRLPYRVRRILARLRSSLRAMARRPAKFAAALALGICLQTLLVMLNAWLGSACGIDIPVTTWLFVWPMAKLSALLPLTQGGLGVREAALAALFSPFGVPPVLAVAAGLIFQGVIISGGLLGGLLAYLLARREAQSTGSAS